MQYSKLCNIWILNKWTPLALIIDENIFSFRRPMHSLKEPYMVWEAMVSKQTVEYQSVEPIAPQTDRCGKNTGIFWLLSD